MTLNDAQRQRMKTVYERYRLLHDDPEHCLPMIIVNAPGAPPPRWEEQLADPLVMLKAELNKLQSHLDVGDDCVPTVRVQFGTAQVAAAFGCAMHLPENGLPAAGSHVLEHAEDVYGWPLPSLDAGWYGKLMEWTAIWKRHLPEGVHIQHPDIQSAFNSAHLIRGNDILTDFYDHPEALEALLDKVTDFMVAITRHVKSVISDDPAWFFDWGALWKGFARISNCSMQMISPEQYREHVLPRDRRFFEAVGGGRMHYCGLSGAVIDDFFRVPGLTGLDMDCLRHDVYALCERAPREVVLMLSLASELESPVLRRMLAGDWPAKRNIVVIVPAPSVEEGRRLLGRLRASIPT